MALIMNTPQVEYKGYVISPTLTCDATGKYFGGYAILKGANVLSRRENLFPGFFYTDAARDDSIEHAKLEIDNWQS
jgi:hypothetical protein